MSRSPSKIAGWTLAASIAAGLAAPTVHDVMVRQTATPVAGYASSTAAFDLGGMMNAIVGAISSWFSDLSSYQDGIVAAFEKQDGAEKEIAQAGLNQEAAQATTQASQEAVDLVGAALPDACQIAQEKKETVEAKRSEIVAARAMTAYDSRRSMGGRPAATIQSELLQGSNSDYCSPEAVMRGRCTQASPKNLPDADIHANSIMGTSTGSSETLSEDEYAAAQAYVKWVSDPLPAEALPIAVEKTPAGQRFLVEQRRRVAVNSAVQFSLNRMISSRYEKH